MENREGGFDGQGVKRNFGETFLHLPAGDPLKLSKAVPIQLKGVPYAARMSASMTIKGEAREQGWIYAFAEPFQIFILYLITDKDRAADQGALEQALSSFEYLGAR